VNSEEREEKKKKMKEKVHDANKKGRSNFAILNLLNFVFSSPLHNSSSTLFVRHVKSAVQPALKEFS